MDARNFYIYIYIYRYISEGILSKTFLKKIKNILKIKIHLI